MSALDGTDATPARHRHAGGTGPRRPADLRFRPQTDATASRRLYAGAMEQSIRDTLGSARVRRGADIGLAVGLALLALADQAGMAKQG